jgi:hypothetical protein
MIPEGDTKVDSVGEAITPTLTAAVFEQPAANPVTE